MFISSIVTTRSEKKEEEKVKVMKDERKIVKEKQNNLERLLSLNFRQVLAILFESSSAEKQQQLPQIIFEIIAYLKSKSSR